jgi:hypothetical protein
LHRKRFTLEEDNNNANQPSTIQDTSSTHFTFEKPMAQVYLST